MGACQAFCGSQAEKQNELTLLDELFANNNQNGQFSGVPAPARKESVKANGAANDDFLLFFDDAPTNNNDPQSVSPPPDSEPTSNEHGDDFSELNFDQGYGNEI